MSDNAAHTPQIYSNSRFNVAANAGSEVDSISLQSRDASFPQQLARNLFQRRHLNRTLEREHITAIAFSGTVGIGLFVTSGELISIAGSLGAVLSYICAGTIVIGVMRSLAEMVAVRPVPSGIIDFPHSFVDPALGFAVGTIYLLAQCLSMATLQSAAARVANNFHPSSPLSHSQTAAVIVGFLVVTLGSNIFGVRIYGNLERFVKAVKLLTMISLCVLMIAVNLGVGGYSTDRTSRNYSSNALTPSFQPGAFNSTAPEENEASRGISGSTGQFLSVWTAITLAVFACMGGDIVVVTAGEARYPRRDLPGAARFMYLLPIGFYILSSFLVGFNINYSDPDLYRPFATQSDTKFPSTSPFVIVLKHTNLSPHIITKVYETLFMFSAYTAGNTALFTASRTLFSMVNLYGNEMLKKIFATTDNKNTPIAAILACSLFGFLAFLGLIDDDFNQPILSMSAFFTGSICCVYASECIAFLRFKKGLDARKEKFLLSRDDPIWKEKYYRGSWQPMWAIIGLCGSLLIMLFSGWSAIYVIRARDHLKGSNELKPDRLLAADLVGAYAGPIIFLTLLIFYKIFRKNKSGLVDVNEMSQLYDIPDFEGNPDFDKDPFADGDYDFGYEYEYGVRSSKSDGDGDRNGSASGGGVNEKFVMGSKESEIRRRRNGGRSRRASGRMDRKRKGTLGKLWYWIVEVWGYIK